MVALRSFRHSGPSFADLVPYAGLVANGVILLKDGSLMAGWYFAGPDSESSTDAERNDVSRQINAILARLGSGWMIQAEAVRVTGNPSLIIIDEAWLMLGHPTFRSKIREWLKVLRKANCAVLLATQSISDAERSGIVDVLKESCPTKICLPNGAARESGTREFYERIGFNSRQIEIVATALPKREYYVASPVGRRLFDMALGPVALAFVGAAGKDDLKHIRTLHSEHGTAWPRYWLEQRGIAHAASLLPNV